MTDFEQIEEGDRLLVGVEWREESIHHGRETVEMVFEVHDEEESEIVVRYDGEKYRIPDDYDERLVCLFGSQHCANCGQHYWPSHGFVHDVEFPGYVDEYQLTLADAI